MVIDKEISYWSYFITEMLKTLHPKQENKDDG
ncbi:hypothetical protein OMDBNIEC_00061 [Salmonella phage STP-SP5]|nr:hypothetical protein OMDBNIEC_00061 [Salmonella phage STP-SP5]